MYDLTARSLLRAFIRKLMKVGEFKTAQGKANLYAGKTQLALQLRTVSSKKPIVLKYRIIRAAIQQTYALRTITRKDLEGYTKGANSALLGILIEIFKDSAKVHRTVTGLIRLTLKGVRYFFAGVDRVKRDLEVAAANGAKFVLMSYAHIRRRTAWKKHVLRLGLKIMLDSGAFTVWEAIKAGKDSLEKIDIDEYILFIKTHQDVIHSYVNLDVIGDPASSKANAKHMQNHGLKPIEVWHAGNNIHELASLVSEDQAIIAIGGTVGMSEKRRARLFRWVFKLFPDQNFHFLGGSSKLLHAFPWFSADSTGWIVGRKYGSVIDRKGQRKAPHMDPIDALAYNCKYFSGLEAA
ncbi:hypothetical protein AAXB25_22740 [Paenibacillus lautus]|uniref:hypothetical protein n=1 Tax=Paenibacillus lautus TaxID=1401 RepID=UPI003D2A275E